MRWRKLIIIFLISALLSGCLETRILEQIGLQVIVGYDLLSQPHRYMGTSILYQVEPDSKEETQIIVSTAYTSKGIRSAANREVSKKLQSGQLRVALYSEKLARKGIADIVDTLYRDPAIGNMIYLGVVKGTSKDLLIHRYPEIANVGTYLYRNFEQNIDGENIPSCTLHEYLNAYYTEGKDPILPYIERKNNDLFISKLAVFRDDKVVGLINPLDGFYIKLIRERYKAGHLEISLNSEPFKKYARIPIKENKLFMVIDDITSKSKISIKDMKIPEWDVNIKLNARLMEISAQLPLENPEVLQVINKKIGEAIESDAKELLHRLQKMRSDPIGFGERYMSSIRFLKIDREKARDLFIKSKFNVNVEVDLIRTGTIE